MRRLGIGFGLGFNFRPRQGGAGGTPTPAPTSSLLANDSQAFWLMRKGALMAGTSMFVVGCSGTQSKGNIEVHDITGGVRKTYWMGQRSDGVDDHNNPSLSILPDGRVMSTYSQHTEATGTMYRISTTAPPVVGWGREFLIPKHASSAGVSYHHTFHMENGKTYVCRRENVDSLNRREQGISYIDTSALESADAPAWTVERMMKRDNARPYALYEKWGSNRIFCVASYGHPDEVSSNCNMYGFYIDVSAEAPTYWKMDGTQIVAAVPWDLAAEATLIAAEAGVNDGEMWPLDVIIGPDGQPWALYMRKPAGGGTGAGGRALGLDYWFARWTGSAWVNHQLSTNNRTPLASQPAYVPGLCFDRSDARKIFMSESGGDNIAEIYLYSFDEVTGVKTLIRNVGDHGNGREKVRLMSPEGASPPTPIIYSEIESYASITAFEMHMHSEAAVTIDGVTSGALDSATTALIARMSSAPNATWERLYDWLVRRLKVGGLNGTDNWSDLGAFYNFIAHDAQAARLDWKGSLNASVNGSPTFTAGVGFIGINTTTDTWQLPAPNSIPGFAQNSAHAAVSFMTNTSGTTALRRSAAGSPVLIDTQTLRINESGGLSRSSGTNTFGRSKRQFVVANRSGSTATRYDMDGATMKTGTGASVAPDSAALLVGYSTNMTVETVSLGAAKSLAQMQDLDYALAGFRRLVQSRAAP